MITNFSASEAARAAGLKFVEKHNHAKNVVQATGHFKRQDAYLYMLKSLTSNSQHHLQCDKHVLKAQIFRQGHNFHRCWGNHWRWLGLLRR